MSRVHTPSTPLQRKVVPLFSLNDNEKEAISDWVTQVKDFFNTTGELVKDPSEAFHLNATKTRPQISTSSSILDLLEAISVHSAVQLISVLGNVNENVRVNAAYLLIKLANVFDFDELGKLDSDKTNKIILGFGIGEKGFHQMVHALFSLIGKSLKVMAVQIVTGLECFYSCPDPNIRAICISALSRIVFENGPVFQQDDQLTAVWNLYFCLNTLPMVDRLFPDRIVIIQALGLLSHLYCASDLGLTFRIMDALLRLKNKTAMETTDIKLALTKLFARINDPAAYIEAAQIKSSEDDPMQKAIRDCYNIFLNLISPQDEYAYDLLSWSLETFTEKVYSIEDTKPKKPIAKKINSLTTIGNNNAALLEFILNLSNHYRATPALVRYGAGVSLHSAVKIFPKLIQGNRGLYQFIISGCLDPDFLTSFLFMTLLPCVKEEEVYAPPTSIAPERKTSSRRASMGTKPTTAIEVTENVKIKEMVDKLCHKATKISYDMLYGCEIATEETEISIGMILDKAVLNSPPLNAKMLHKMANSLEYLAKPMKLKQLELIRVWAGRNEKFDGFLIQIIMPLMSTSDQESQIASIKVMQSLMPSFSNASDVDIGFAWNNFKELIRFKTSSVVLREILILANFFPLSKLSLESQKNFLNVLFDLTFHPDALVRNYVYEILAEMCKLLFPFNEGLYLTSFTMLLLSIGEQDSVCLSNVLNHLFELTRTSTTFKDITSNITDLQDYFSLNGSSSSTLCKLPNLIVLFENLADMIVKNKAAYAGLIDMISFPGIADKVWNFYLIDAPENYLVRPDEYSYARNFIHSPFWIALLYTRLGIVPPPTNGEENRHAVPTTPSSKRRFICGYLVCLLPTCGIPDPTYRSIACLTALRCCLKPGYVNPGMLKGLMEFLSQQMMTNKYWSFQVSATEILQLIVRLKIQSVSQAILAQYLDMALDVAQNTPTSIVKLGALKLIETFLLVFPVGTTSKLEEIRDVIRALIVDKDGEVSSLACRIYPIIFKNVSLEKTLDYYTYLKNEISALKQQPDHPTVAGDPLLSNLSLDEELRILKMDIVAMGHFSEKTLANDIIRELMFFAKGKSAKLRWVALSSILMQVCFLNDTEANPFMWAILPLYTDPNPEIRQLFIKYINKVPSHLELTCRAIYPHSEDSLVLPIANWEDILLDNASIPVNLRSMEDISIEVTDERPYEFSSNIYLKDDQGLHFPLLTKKVMKRIKSLGKSLSGPVREDDSNFVLYFLQQLQTSPQLQGGAILTLSEFGCIHERFIPQLIQIFISSLSNDIQNTTVSTVEASILALDNIARVSDTFADTIIRKLISQPVNNEGDILALFYMSDMIAESKDSALLSKIIQTYLPIVTGDRYYSSKKRMYAAFLCVEMAVNLSSNHDDIKNVLDAIEVYLETADDGDKLKIYLCLGKILNKHATKHALFRSLLSTSKKTIRHKDPKVRMRSLTIFQIFMKSVSTEEFMFFCFIYMADSNKEIRTKAKEAMILQNMFDFAIPDLNSLSTSSSKEVSKRSALLFSCKLPSRKESSDSLASVVPEKEKLTETDIFNLQYYSSEKGSKYLSIYGLPAKQFKINQQETDANDIVSLLYILENEKASFISKPTKDQLEKNRLFNNIDGISILHECMKKYPKVAVDLIELILSDIESRIKEKQTNTSTEDQSPSQDHDVESNIHIIDLCGNLLNAFDGVNGKIIGFVDRFRGCITLCNDSAKIIREMLYAKMESSFFYFNEYCDIPIVSEEQYIAQQNFQKSTQEATLEIVKSGRTEKLVGIEERRNALNEEIDELSEQLRKLTIMAVHATSSYGIFHAISNGFADSDLIVGFQYLTDMLENEHRGIRNAAVEALVIVSQTQCDKTLNNRPQFLEKIRDTVKSFIEKLANEEDSLLRRKEDVVKLLGQLLEHVADKSIKRAVVLNLIGLWRDPDSAVRICAIEMIQRLGESGMEEVMDCFNEDTKNLSIMKEVSRLMSNEDYIEKDLLQNLLNWRFST